MRIAAMHGKVPCYVQSGKAPYDAAGFYYDSAATALGVELKETSGRETSLPIIGPDKRGSGLQYHQLTSLVDLHHAGGVALLLWSNAGEIGLLKGPALHNALLSYDTSLKAERAKKSPAKGSRSIVWGLFDLVKTGLLDTPLWLPSSPVEKRKVG